MSETNLLKFVEAGALLAALVLFVWWQLRDLKKAAAETARKRQQSESHAAAKLDRPSEEAPAPVRHTQASP